MTTGDSKFVMPKVSFGHFSIFFQSFTSWNTSFFKIMTSAILALRHCDAESTADNKPEREERPYGTAKQV